MQDKKDDQSVFEKPVDKAGKATALPPEKSKPTGNGKLWCLVLLLLVITVAEYYFFTHDLSRLETDVQKHVTTANRGQGEIRRSLRELQNRQTDQEMALLENRPQEKSSSQALALAEIEYLLIIATHRLTLERDVGTALAAMQAADSRLQGLADPGLSPLRAQITADLNQLRAIDLPDISSLAVYLADLSERSAALPLRAEAMKRPAESKPDDLGTVSDPRPVWQKLPVLWWREIRNLLRIERIGSEQFLLPDQAYFLSQNLRLELTNARYAVLRLDTENLRASAGLIQDWLSRYFDTDNASVANTIETMQAMMQIELQPPLPDLSSSLESVRAYLRHANEVGAEID